MNLTRPLLVRGQPVADGREPLLCAPLVGRDETELREELAAVVAKSPDLLEWRLDFFAGIGDAARLKRIAADIRAGAAGIPIILTRRSQREGGEAMDIDEAAVLAAYEAVCSAGGADFIDWELSATAEEFAAARELAHRYGIQLIASFHDFQATPAASAIVARLAAMQAAGADIAKVAVMPQAADDVLTLLQATRMAREQLEIPIITMSMGGYGALSRMVGWVFGSSVSFAVGRQASAPGQVPIEDLRQVLDVLHRSLGND